MELTVEALREVRFHEGWRGYNLEEVDAFIESVVIGVEALNEKIRELTLRSERAEARSVGENDETVKRTLILAQKAADLVVTEARAVGTRIVEDAKRDALREESEVRAAQLLEREAAMKQFEEQTAAKRKLLEDELVLSHQELSAHRDVAHKEKLARHSELDEISAHALASHDQLRTILTEQLAKLDSLKSLGSIGSRAAGNLVGDGAPELDDTIAAANDTL